MNTPTPSMASTPMNAEQKRRAMVFGSGIAFALMLYFADDLADFWTGLFKVLFVGLLLLNWRIFIAPKYAVRHVKKYVSVYRYIAVSALLPAAFLAGMPAPVLFVGMLAYAFYIVKTVPWIREAKDLSASRWLTTLMILVLVITGLAAWLQTLNAKGTEQTVQVSTSKTLILSCAEEAWYAKQRKQACEDDPVKRAEMNNSESIGEKFPAVVGLFKLSGATMLRMVKYWLMFSVLGALTLVAKMVMLAKEINQARETIARDALVAAGAAQNDKNVADFLANDVNTTGNVKSYCDQKGVDPDFLKFAGAAPRLFHAFANVLGVLAMPLVFSAFPCVAMTIPSARNNALFNKPKPTFATVVQGFALRNLDGTVE